MYSHVIVGSEEMDPGYLPAPKDKQRIYRYKDHKRQMWTGRKWVWTDPPAIQSRNLALEIMLGLSPIHHDSNFTTRGYCYLDK